MEDESKSILARILYILLGSWLGWFGMVLWVGPENTIAKPKTVNAGFGPSLPSGECIYEKKKDVSPSLPQGLHEKGEQDSPEKR